MENQNYCIKRDSLKTVGWCLIGKVRVNNFTGLKAHAQHRYKLEFLVLKKRKRTGAEAQCVDGEPFHVKISAIDRVGVGKLPKSLSRGSTFPLLLHDLYR